MLKVYTSCKLFSFGSLNPAANSDAAVIHRHVMRCAHTWPKCIAAEIYPIALKPTPENIESFIWRKFTIAVLLSGLSI